MTQAKIFHFNLEIDCTQEQWNEIILGMNRAGLATAKNTYEMSEIQ